jgi:TetR/AcrR family transcriptional regulator, regulator of autoinduction and epiphytic fitness
MPRSVKRRSYDSPKRQEQARATRRSILDAARDLFLDRGYAATTIQTIADEAGVAVQTVYAVFGNKRELLNQLVDVAVAGDDEPVPLADRFELQSIEEEPDQRRRVVMHAHLMRQILERAGPLGAVARQATVVDPEFAVLWDGQMRVRRVGLGSAARSIAGRDGLRVDLDTAGDVLWAVSGPEAYEMFIRDLGWSYERYEEWLRDVVERMLLP